MARRPVKKAPAESLPARQSVAPAPTSRTLDDLLSLIAPELDALIARAERAEAQLAEADVRLQEAQADVQRSEVRADRLAASFDKLLHSYNELLAHSETCMDIAYIDFRSETVTELVARPGRVQPFPMTDGELSELLDKLGDRFVIVENHNRSQL